MTIIKRGVNIMSVLILVVVSLLVSVALFYTVKKTVGGVSKHVDVSPISKELAEMRSSLKKVLIAMPCDIPLLNELATALKEANIPVSLIYSPDIKEVPPDSYIYIIPSSIESAESEGSLLFLFPINAESKQFYIPLSDPKNYIYDGDCTYSLVMDRLRLVCSNNEYYSKRVRIEAPLASYPVSYIYIPITSSSPVSYIVSVSKGGAYFKQGVLTTDYILIPVKPSIRSGSIEIILEIPPKKTVSYTIYTIYGLPETLYTLVEGVIDLSSIKLYTQQTFNLETLSVIPSNYYEYKYSCNLETRKPLGVVLSRYGQSSITIHYDIPSAYALSSQYDFILLIRGKGDRASTSIKVNGRVVRSITISGESINAIDITSYIEPSVDITISVSSGTLYIESISLYLKGKHEDYMCFPDLSSKQILYLSAISKPIYDTTSPSPGRVLIIAPQETTEIRRLINTLKSAGFKVYFKKTSEVRGIGFFDYYIVIGDLPYNDFADDVIASGKKLLQVINDPYSNEYVETGNQILMGSITIYDYDTKKTNSILLEEYIYRLIPKRMYPVWISMYGYIVAACTPTKPPLGTYCATTLPIEDANVIAKLFFKLTGIPTKINVYYNRYLEYETSKEYEVLYTVSGPNTYKNGFYDTGQATGQVHIRTQITGYTTLKVVGVTTVGTNSIEVRVLYSDGSSYTRVYPGGYFVLHVPVPEGLYVTQLTITAYGKFSRALTGVRIFDIKYVNILPYIKNVQDIIVTRPSDTGYPLSLSKELLSIDGETTISYDIPVLATHYGTISVGTTLSSLDYASYQYRHTRYTGLLICETYPLPHSEYKICRTLSPKTMRVKDYHIKLYEKKPITPYYIKSGTVTTNRNVKPDYTYPYIFDAFSTTSVDGILKYGIGKGSYYPEQKYSGSYYKTQFVNKIEPNEKTLRLLKVPLLGSTFDALKVLQPIYIVSSTTDYISLYSYPGYQDVSTVLEELKSLNKIVIILASGSTRLPVQANRIILEDPKIVSDILDMNLRTEGVYDVVVPLNSYTVAYDENTRQPIVTSFKYGSTCVIIVPYGLVQNYPELIYNILKNINKVC